MKKTSRNAVPRWPAIAAVLAVGLLWFALPESLTPGPSWLLIVLSVALIIPSEITKRRGNVKANRMLGFAVDGVVTIAMVGSLWMLVSALPAHKETPIELLRSAVVLWFSNILVFASWYWRLDAGGPNARDLRDVHTDGAFLFPQMIILHKDGTTGADGWRPGFVDYLFLAFNTSTAFSPTDVPVLTHWAKLLMMIQATISFATVILLAARAVNIL